eukprot:10577583-Alexandrium_andersonii.AAC.1
MAIDARLAAAYRHPAGPAGPRRRDVHDGQGPGVLHEGAHAHVPRRPRLGGRGLLAGAAGRHRGPGHDAVGLGQVGA